MSATLRQHDSEIQNLRDWRHNTVAPVMIEIQAQQKRNADSIAKVIEASAAAADNISRLAVTIAPLSAMPEELRDHRQSDERSFNAVQEGMKGLHDRLADEMTAVRSTMAENRAQAQKGQLATTIWIAGLLLAGLAGIIASIWAFIQPHLAVH